MRKTLTQTLLAAFCAILAAQPLEGGGVMLIGMRNAMLSGGWKNPYVTDGLVVMWDGEWNVGGGVHDANATVWKDLTNSYSITPTACTFGVNCLNVPANRNVRVITDQSLTTSISQVDIVFRVDSRVTEGGSAIVNNGSATLGNTIFPPLRYVPPFSSRGWHYALQAINGADDAYLGDATLGIANSVCIFKRGGSAWGAYFNGVLKDSVSQTITQASTKIELMRLHGYYYRIFSGAIFSFRAYSRALTADEIAANYAIDKARFNLPDAT